MTRLYGKNIDFNTGGARLYFTEFNISPSFSEITTFGDRSSSYFASLPEITFSGVMTNTEGSRSIIMSLLNSGGIDFTQERREWRCVWCASANPIDHRHCSQCGGPRGWIL